MSQKLDSAINTIANAFIEWVGIPLIRVDIFRLEVIPQEGASVSECARVLAATVCKSKSAYRCVLSLMSDELHSLRLRRGGCSVISNALYSRLFDTQKWSAKQELGVLPLPSPASLHLLTRCSGVWTRTGLQPLIAKVETFIAI